MDSVFAIDDRSLSSARQHRAVARHRTYRAQRLAHALDAITDTLIGYLRAVLANGADGIFYATNLATRPMLSAEECSRFQRPYDLRVLAAAASAPFNIMHVCGQDALFDEFTDYPVAAFSWALGPANPSLADGHRRTGKAVMGGLPAALAEHTHAEVGRRARAAIDEVAGRRLLLAPDWYRHARRAAAGRTGRGSGRAQRPGHLPLA